MGKTLVEHLLSNGETDITLYNRGITNPDLFPELKRIKGDRHKSDFKELGGNHWDIIFDISNYYPLHLSRMLDRLKGQIGKYVYVSTMSVYDISNYELGNLNEDHPMLPCSDEEMVDAGGASYGARKAECERVIQGKEWLDAVSIRPALIVGPYDYTNRLYYWFQKAATQDRFLMPDNKDNLLAYADVDDLAEMMIFAATKKTKHRVYNGASYNASLVHFVKYTAKALNRKPELLSVSPEFLFEHELGEWNSLPLWLKDNRLTVDNSRIVEESKIKVSTWQETADKLLEYYGKELKWEYLSDYIEKRGALNREKEEELIKVLQ